MLLLTLLLRIVYLNHVLSYDEALNVLKINDYGSHNTVWTGLVSQHPPIYLGIGLLFQKITHASIQNVALFLELLSILSSMAIVFLVYLCGKDWFNEKTGLLAAFFYAILPAARVFDSWIKQDAMMMALALAFLLFFFRKKYVIAGLFLGMALLAKEPVVFIIVAVGIFLLISKRFKNILMLLLSSAIAVLISGWWYLFFSKSTGGFINSFLGKSVESKTFAAPWYHFIVRVPQDVGLVVLILSILAIVFFFISFKAERGGMIPFLLVWILVIYAILSITPGKSPWVIHTVLPPFALLGGWGLARISELPKNSKLSSVVIGISLLLALGLSLSTGFSGYMTKPDNNYEGWVQEERMMNYVNSKNPDSVMVTFDDLNPVMCYYLNNYSPEKTVYLPADLPVNAKFPNKTLYLIDPKTDFNVYKQRIKTVAPRILIIANHPTLIEGFSKYDNPQEFRTGYVYDGHRIAADIKNGK